MLHVTIHAGPLESASRNNQRGWLDIGYDRLAPVADYQTVLFQDGMGATLPVPIYNYPRWSASLWDLVARAIALGLRTDQDCLNEEVPPIEQHSKRFAFADSFCALIEHAPLTGRNRRTLATVQITQQGRTRGCYVALFTEHTMADHVTTPFEFRPVRLWPAELLLHACLVRLTGKAELPPRPALCVPTPIEHDGIGYVPIHRLVEPARTGFVTWLHRLAETPIEHRAAPQGLVQQARYVQFLTEAI